MVACEVGVEVEVGGRKTGFDVAGECIGDGLVEVRVGKVLEVREPLGAGNVCG